MCKENLWIVESDNIRRKAKQSVCVQCNNTFLQRKNGKKKYCTQKCMAESNKNRIHLNCDRCGIEFERQISRLKLSKSGLYFCTRKCKDEAQSIKFYDNIYCNMIPQHYDGGTSKYWKRQLLETQNACVGCGENRSYLLVAHHKDGNSKNNCKGNLEIVCHNCHACRHLMLNEDGSWVYHTKALTPRELLEKI